MKKKLDVDKFKLPPFPLTYFTRERVIVEENIDSTLIEIESLYNVVQVVNRPPVPISITKTCGNIDTWRIIGNHVTLSNGTLSINVTKFLNCRDIDYKNLADFQAANFIGNIPLFLATAQSVEPVFLTYDLDISYIAIPPPHVGQPPAIFVPNPAIDVSVIVKSWKHDGAPAPAIKFSWMAIGEKTAFYNP